MCLIVEAPKQKKKRRLFDLDILLGTPGTGDSKEEEIDCNVNNKGIKRLFEVMKEQKWKGKGYEVSVKFYCDVRLTNDIFVMFILICCYVHLYLVLDERSSSSSLLVQTVDPSVISEIFVPSHD